MLVAKSKLLLQYLPFLDQAQKASLQYLHMILEF